MNWILQTYDYFIMGFVWHIDVAHKYEENNVRAKANLVENVEKVQ